jgi:hemolysin activation/secretion protein
LTKATEPFTNRPLSFAQLLQVADAVTQLYKEQGYITSGAFISPQEIRDGTVIIQVIEGGLDSINVTGLKRLKPDYVRSRIAIATQQPLNINRLLQALQLLQLNPLIANLSAELSAGPRPGLSVLEVQVEEALALSAQLRFDNQQVASVGTDRRGIELSHANFFGFGDRFNVRYYNTDGSNALDDLSYTIPINPYNGSIGLRYRTITSEVIQELFNELDINSDYQEYEITYRQPIWQNPREEFTLGLSFDRQESNTSLTYPPDILKGKTSGLSRRN